MARRRDQRSKSFADIVASAKATPSPRTRRAPGLHRDGHWVNRSGQEFDLVSGDPSTVDAAGLVRSGAGVVYDPCGCGGFSDCPTPVEWMNAEALERLKSAPGPVLHPSKDGSAGLEHWRSIEGLQLVVVVNEVTWGEDIRG